MSKFTQEYQWGTGIESCKYTPLARLELGRLLGAATLLIRLVLHGPQGPQGGDLGLGQAADARNSEPLVGPVTAQRAQMLATLEVPEVDGPVIAATGEPAAIGTDLERPHRSLMGLL